MKEALTTATPNVLVGVNAIQFNVAYQLQFRATYEPTPRFGTLNFKVLLTDQQNKWRRLQFNFIATNNPQISANSLAFNQLSADLNKTRFALVSRIPLEDYMTAKSIIQTYVSGISLRSKKSRDEMEAAVKSVQNLQKLFSWNRGAITAANKMIETYSLLNFQLNTATIANKTLTVTLTITDSVILDSVIVSYIVFNQIDFMLKNNLIYQMFTLGGTGANSTFGFAPLQNTDLTFIGLRGLQFKLVKNLQIQFAVSRNRNLLNISPAPALPQEGLLYAGFLQAETKFESQCQNCPESIYRFETFCLDICPRGYVNIQNGANSTCKYCNISQFLIPNSNNTECVCAAQYFLNPSSKQCEPCHFSCLSCRNSSACDSCDSFDLTTKRVFSNSNQLCSCIDGFFDNQNLICQKCHESCLACSGSSIYQCLKCKAGRSFDSSNRCQCGANYVDEGGQCVCKDPNFEANNVCYSKTPINSICAKPNMLQRSVNGKSVCECVTGFEMYKGDCVSCPKTFILNQATGICECSKTAFLISNNTCVQCDSMKYYDLKFQRCMCKKQYFQKEDGSCVDCPDKSTYLDGKCQCVFNYFWQNGVCVKCKKTEDDVNCLRVDVAEL